MKILVLNGPNMDLLGRREPDIYGRETLESVMDGLRDTARGMNVTLSHFQSNHEGALIDAMRDAALSGADGFILNAAAYTHTSVALRDAIAAWRIPTIEVHISNIYAREDFRRASLISPVCAGVISGFGVKSYALALTALYDMLSEDE